MAIEPFSTLLPFNTLIHMVTIKLSSSNYLLWKSQLLPLLESQELIDYVDETIEIPSHFTIENSQTPNIKHVAWKHTDQCLLSLLLSSLTEEAMAEVVGLSTSCEVWVALENTFNHHSKAREIYLNDDLQLMKRGTRSISEYARTLEASTINSMQSDDPSMALTKCIGFSEVWAGNSQPSPRPKWPSPFCPVL
ncbi:hypothetical protein CK203_083049 [Vitis vinifera]|uniref:Retrovirus-related Pol polyprotein from transposon RE1 n=1 Tax=Vitis vinifera TaxID=29760 RepID=A0A438E5D9_VITVI|nr:hypothetical protein CK203_083049 [Vitis vinifera]